MASNMKLPSEESFSPVTEEEVKVYQGLMKEANVEMDLEVLLVVAQLMRLGVPPEEIYRTITQVAPVCGLLKRFKLKPQRSNQDPR